MQQKTNQKMELEQQIPPTTHALKGSEHILIRSVEPMHQFDDKAHGSSDAQQMKQELHPKTTECAHSRRYDTPILHPKHNEFSASLSSL
jgi:hypothetical protein